MENIAKQLELKTLALQERIKEKNCLLAITECFSLQGASLKSLFSKVIQFVLPAWQFPELAYARIVYAKIEVKSDNFQETPYRLKMDLNIKGKKCGFIEVGYTEIQATGDKDFILPEERKLFEAISKLTENLIEKRNTERTMHNASLKLVKQTAELKRKNLVLKEILSQIEIEKRELEKQVAINIKKLILPSFNHLKNEISTERGTKYLATIEKNLADISSPFVKKALDCHVKLSPKEIEICNLIRNGMQNKDIAKMLHISLLTVERHRFNIRKKLNLTNNKVNLLSFLQKY